MPSPPIAARRGRSRDFPASTSPRRRSSRSSRARSNRRRGRRGAVGARFARGEDRGLRGRALLWRSLDREEDHGLRLGEATGVRALLMLGWFRRRPHAKSHPIDRELWRAATASWLFMRGVRADEDERLHALSERFLAAKQFSGTHGLEVTPLMQVEIAAQACILVLELGLDWY